jgi:hypothetical protein
MAKASDFVPPPGWKWELLGDYLARAAKVYSEVLADQLVRQKLERKELAYSYFCADGRLHRNDLPQNFWLKAEFDLSQSHVWAAVPRYPETAQAAARVLAMMGRAPIDDFPAIHAYKVAVLVRDEMPVAGKALVTEPPTSLSSAQQSALKFPGQKWIERAFKRKQEQFRKTGVNITDAAKNLAEESKTAADCKRSLTWGYIKNVLRNSDLWHTPPKKRKSLSRRHYKRRKST